MSLKNLLITPGVAEESSCKQELLIANSAFFKWCQIWKQIQTKEQGSKCSSWLTNCLHGNIIFPRQNNYRGVKGTQSSQFYLRVGQHCPTDNSCLRASAHLYPRCWESVTSEITANTTWRCTDCFPHSVVHLICVSIEELRVLRPVLCAPRCCSHIWWSY